MICNRGPNAEETEPVCAERRHPDGDATTRRVPCALLFAGCTTVRKRTTMQITTKQQRIGMQAPTELNADTQTIGRKHQQGEGAEIGVTGKGDTKYSNQNLNSKVCCGQKTLNRQTAVAGDIHRIRATAILGKLPTCAFTCA